MSIYKCNQEKQKWIEEYKNLIQNFKNEEFCLLKLFLLKNYHLNKVYKKYAYNEKNIKNYFSETQRKIKNELNEIYENKNYGKFKDLIKKIKEESNKSYKNLIKEENKIENDLKKYDNNTMIIYENEFEEWIKDNKNIMLNNSDIDKENTSISNIDKYEQKQNFNSTNFNTDNDCIKNSEISSFQQDNKSNNSKYFVENSDDKIKAIKLSEFNLLKPYKTDLEIFDNPIKYYIKNITKEIHYIYMPKFSSNTNNNYNKLWKPPTNINEEEKLINNDIKLFLNMMTEDRNSISYLNDEIKNINRIIKEDLGGIFLGWIESEHKEFIKLKNKFKDKINSFLFLSTLNNIFPYMTVVKLKKHIKLYDIYLKLEHINNLLIEKNNSMKIIVKTDKINSLKQLNTSISVTKSFSSFKINRFDKKRNNFKSLDNKRNSRTINKAKLNEIKINKDYFKISLKYRTKDNFYNEEKKSSKNYKSINSFNVIRKKKSNNYFFIPKNK